MEKRTKLVSTVAVMIACLIAATLFFTARTYSTGFVYEPESLADIIEFPLQYSGTSNVACSVTLTDPTVNAPVIASFATRVDGESNIMNELAGEGSNILTVGPPYFGGTSDQCVDFTGTINTVTFNGAAMGWWTNYFLGPNGNQRALFVMAFDLTTGTSIVVSAVTNLSPPDQVVPGWSIVNTMPYIYVNFTFWAGTSFGNTSPREVSWYYWQYSSNYNPNWFWSTYLWWRTYLKSYGLTYNAWYWWFWHWYYTEFWYYWGTSFPY
jgi:hypothetical protein